MRTAFFPGLWLVTCVLGSTTMLVVGCSDTDPNYGPPGAIYNDNYKPIPGGSSTSGTSGTSGTTTTDPKAAFAALFDSTKATCGGCHANAASAGNKPENVFFGPAAGPTADETYTLFKKAGNDFHKDKATNRFYNVAASHPGPALKDDQKKLMETWIAAETTGGSSSGTTSPTDAGGG